MTKVVTGRTLWKKNTLSQSWKTTFFRHLELDLDKTTHLPTPLFYCEKYLGGLVRVLSQIIY